MEGVAEEMIRTRSTAWTLLGNERRNQARRHRPPRQPILYLSCQGSSSTLARELSPPAVHEPTPLPAQLARIRHGASPSLRLNLAIWLASLPNIRPRTPRQTARTRRRAGQRRAEQRRGARAEESPRSRRLLRASSLSIRPSSTNFDRLRSFDCARCLVRVRCGRVCRVHTRYNGRKLRTRKLRN